MSQISRETIEQILNATDIVDLISSHVPLKRAGAMMKACCPFHHEKTPSFSVSPARQRYHCFGCSKSGDAITFLMDYEGLPYVEALKKLALRVGIPIIETSSHAEADESKKARHRLIQLHQAVAQFMHEQLLHNPEAEHARAYLKKRGLSLEIAKDWLIGWMPENDQLFRQWAKEKRFTGRELVDSGLMGLRQENRPKAGTFVRFRDRLMFSICNEMGDVIAFSGRQLKEDPTSGKYINSPETLIFKKSNVIFAMHRAKKAIAKQKMALLCEGQLDVIACHQYGIDYAIAPLGTAFTKQHARQLKRYCHTVLLCYDADKAGIAASDRAFIELASEGLEVKSITLNQGEDPDSFIKQYGVQAMLDRTQQAGAFFAVKLQLMKQNGLLNDASDYLKASKSCADLLAFMTDSLALDEQINTIATFLQISSQLLREEVQKAKHKKDRLSKSKGFAESDASSEPSIEPSALHHIVGYLCQLSLKSTAVQRFLNEQYETLSESKRWIEGIQILDRILTSSPNPESPSSINQYLASLPASERMALDAHYHHGDAIQESLADAESALSILSSLVLQKRDAAIKASLSEPSIDSKRMIMLLQEAKEIQQLMQHMGQRIEFNDALPPATFRPKEPKWKKK